ncbi:MAG: DUF5615 family PIN-like protein [Magnetococcales bacterium]|nr:DUF5615 family PIN-like protein [Magnetococcales bacterium]
MKFKVDENLPAEAASFLRSAGHDALSVLNQSMGGASDGQVFRICQEEQRILVSWTWISPMSRHIPLPGARELWCCGLPGRTRSRSWRPYNACCP